jgi:phosphatidylinositol alpha-mannosyltransferase
MRDGHLLAFMGSQTVGSFLYMRVALVTEFYYPHLGGVTEHVHNLARTLVQSGHHAIIITSHVAESGRGHELGELDDDPAYIHRVGTSRVIYSYGSFARVTTGFGLRRRIREILRQERIDLMHVHGGLNPTLGLVAPEAARDLDIPVVATFHSWFHRSTLCQIFRRPLQRRLDRHAAVIAVSQPVVEAHARYFDADWKIIPNGVDTAFFRPTSSRHTFDRDPEPELLFLGRLDPRNGLDTVLAAMPQVLAEFPEVRLTIAGDGPLRRVYERLAAPVARHVSFIGSVNGNRPTFYSRADLYLCPTTKASFGITLLEAMACATPMVVSDITGFRELVSGGDEAVLVPRNDSGAWAETIIALLQDKRRRERMGSAGRTKAARFAWPHVAREVTAVYRSVLGC